MIHELWIKGQYLEQIIERRKDLEIRVGYPRVQAIKRGDQLCFKDGRGRSVLVHILDIRQYPNLSLAVGQEDPNRIAPGMGGLPLLNALGEIYPPEKERRGVYVIEFRVISTT